MDRLDEYFALPDSELFAAAANINAGKRKIRASPTILDERCATKPPCNHCKWEFFKACGIQKGRARTVEESIGRAELLEELDIGRTFFASGWMGYTLPDSFFEHIRAVRAVSSLELYGLFGALDRESLAAMKEAGMDGYLCSLEAPDHRTYLTFRPGGDSFASRLHALGWAKELGLKVWSGFLVGFGETQEATKQGLCLLAGFEPESLSILPFTPFPHTPMAGAMPANPLGWARTVAVATLFMPGSNIFTDQEREVYGAYSDLVRPNGLYDTTPEKRRMHQPA